MTEIPLTAVPDPVIDPLQCDFDGCASGPNGTAFVASAPQGLGSHKRRAHGVQGVSRRSRGAAKPVRASARAKAKTVKRRTAKPSTNGSVNSGLDRRRSGVRAQLALDFRLATAVQAIYPRGIPTSDLAELTEDLRQINRLRERLARG